MKPDYYAVLGVSPDSRSEEIHKAWRAMVRRSHPDRNPAEAETRPMALINEAWAVLGNPSSRKLYDLERRVPEPVAVQDVILRAASSMLFTPVERGKGIARDDMSGRDVALVRGPTRVSVRLLRIAGPDDVGAWLRAAAAGGESSPPEVAVLLTCRLLWPDDAASRIHRNRFPAVAIDMIESRLVGDFPSEVSRGLFRALLE